MNPHEHFSDNKPRTPVVAGLGKGGARFGSGRKRGPYVTQQDKDAAAAQWDDSGDWTQYSSAEAKLQKERASAHKEFVLAKSHELEFLARSGEYLPRAAFREATATLLATLAQRLRSLPDELERRCPLSPEVLERIEQVVDEVLANAADDLMSYTEVQP